MKYESSRVLHFECSDPLLNFISGELSLRPSNVLFSSICPAFRRIARAAGVTIFRSFGHNIAMPASRALRADLIPEKIRGKLFGRFAAFFSLGAIIGPILSTWLYYIFRFETIEISWLGNLSIRGAGLPFLVSGAIGLFSLFLLLVFVDEPKINTNKKCLS